MTKIQIIIRMFNISVVHTTINELNAENVKNENNKKRLHIYIHTYTFVYIYLYVCMFVCMYVCMYVCRLCMYVGYVFMYVDYVCMYVGYVCIYRYIYISDGSDIRIRICIYPHHFLTSESASASA